MRRISAILSLALTLAIVTLLLGPASLALTRDARRAIMRNSVLITPLKLDAAGRVVNIPWSGSGTIIDASGLILTNYHVVQPSAEWDTLGISITSESDQPPAPAYLAQVVAGDAAIDLAVIKIVADSKGNAVDATKLALTPVKLGDADSLEIGDDLTVFGYPGIGSSTITLTEGRVSGFLQEQGVSYRRAWIKTDAAIAGGNSGGTAVDADGLLVAIPTRVGDLDVRRLVDTNGDGIIDENDTPVSTGGFINQLRPINLAFTLIEQAKKAAVKPGTGVPPVAGPTPTPGKRTTSGPSMSAFVFASELDASGLPLDAASEFAGGITTLYAFTNYAGMANQAACTYEWMLDGESVADGSFAWTSGAAGTFHFSLGNNGDAMPEGEYDLAVAVNGKVLQSGTASVYGSVESSGVTLSGYLVDADTGRPVSGAYFYVLAPGVTVSQFVRLQRQSQVAATGVTGRDGYYRVAPPLARGYTYSAVIAAEGYTLIGEDNALPIDASTPDEVEMDDIELSRE